jgi:hypothetical protein
MSNGLKALLLILGIVLVVFGVYYFVSQSSIAGDSVDVQNEELVRRSEKIVSDIATLDSIRIDDEIFTDPRFMSLTDTRVSLVEVATGRSNPFAPLD